MEAIHSAKGALVMLKTIGLGELFRADDILR
jgi:hypothetical protein